MPRLIGEELSCQREAENYTDPFAIVVMKDDNQARMCCNIRMCTFVPEKLIFTRLFCFVKKSLYGIPRPNSGLKCLFVGP